MRRTKPQNPHTVEAKKRRKQGGGSKVARSSSKDSSVSEFELTRYMKTRGWVSTFTAVEISFTRALHDEDY